VLDALGIDTSGRGWIARAVAAYDAEQAARLVEPVLVAWDGNLVVPPDVDAELTLEDGTTSAFDARVTAALPAGYHELRVTRGSRTARALVISTPIRAWRPSGRHRHWGVYAPLCAAPRRRSRPGRPRRPPD
jgi:hypothetical protein